jgi:phenylpropionate dioxygenase-like ring-hydroxylating dioxygenase large terminal subunit
MTTSDVTVGLPLSRSENESLASRLFQHVEDRSTDLAPGVVRIDPKVFSDETIAEEERLHIFGCYPVVAAHASELAGVGDFRTVQLANNEILLVRQPDGSVRGFVNACRHRGARLVLEPTGSARGFACGYHGWTYKTDGDLRAIAHGPTFGDVDKTCMGLIRVPVQERHGFVWVIDSPGTEIDVASWLGGELDETFTAFGLEDYVCWKAESYTEEVNWKVLVDAFIDGYHFAAAHSKSVAQYFYNNLAAFDLIGDHHSRFVTARRSLDKIRNEPPGAQPLDNHVSIGYFLRPHTNLLRQPDHFVLLTFQPLPGAVAGCRMDVRLLIRPGAAAEMQERWERNWQILQDVLRDEDLVLNRNLQHALGNRSVAPLYFGRNEIANQWFHNWLRDVVPSYGAFHSSE